MLALIQRVSDASVWVDGHLVSSIGPGLLVFLGVRVNDTVETAHALARKVCRLRVFPDGEGRMNRSLQEEPGELLVVSQFTLYGDTRKGNRPSYSEAAPAELARSLYESFAKACVELKIAVKTGVFQANMDVRLTNRGPITLFCEVEAK
jgi:D-aminoacyl-tRNA deacylase